MEKILVNFEICGDNIRRIQPKVKVKETKICTYTRMADDKSRHMESNENRGQ